jgi:hypothetical protein
MTDSQPSGAVAEVDEAALDAMVEPDPNQGRGYARLTESGTPVWALINRMGEPTPENIARVASEYLVPEVVVRAAIRYYERNKPYVDAIILLHNEWFETLGS